MTITTIPLGRETRAVESPWSCATCRSCENDGDDRWCQRGVSRYGRTRGLVTSDEPFWCALHEPREEQR